MNVLASVVAGIILFALTYLLSIRLHNQSEQQKKKTRDAYSREPIYISVATIAHDLMPLFGPHVREGVRVIIVGSDAAYADLDNGDKLISGLKEWLNSGAIVDYILLDSAREGIAERSRSTSVRNRVHSLVGHVKRSSLAKLNEDYANFNFYMLDPKCSKDKILSALVERYYSFHPTLVVSEENQPIAMWVEAKHEPNSNYAYNVKYVSPLALEINAEREEFAGYLEDVESIKSRIIYSCNSASFNPSSINAVNLG